MNLIAWFFLLILQNAAFTWVSRARNSGSYGYHAVAAVFSNGVWFISNAFLIGMVATAGLAPLEIAKLAVIYIVGTTIGSVLMHWVAVNYLETGRRKVGA